jgi:hypothetical protein
METFFRLHPSDEDPEKLLDPEAQVTEPWEGRIYGRCDKCGGSGETLHECESCRASGRDPDCPSCGGELRYRGECPTCEGSGEIDDSRRQGVSVFPAEDGLFRYMLRRDAELKDARLVELEGRECEDEDFDADEGALLVRPTRIVDVREVDSTRVHELREQLD